MANMANAAQQQADTYARMCVTVCVKSEVILNMQMPEETNYNCDYKCKRKSVWCAEVCVEIFCLV